MAPTTFQEAESIYTRATKLELSAQFTLAFNRYFRAAEAFLELADSSTATPDFQARCRANAQKAIQRAEKIQKASKTPGAQISVVTPPIDPFGTDHRTYVLRKSSTVNGIRYTLWNEPVPSSSTTALYSDPNGPPKIPMSMSAASKVITWRRPPRDSLSSSTLTPADIDQNIVSDCSVCASVAVCVQHNKRFYSRLLSSSLFSGNQPGRYDVKVYLNGDFRRISIDDLLPFDESGRPMGISSGSKEIAWPALIEKAYMKLMGGYDFPGSNSSIDLRVLTGWIPEHVDLQSTSFERERTWERIMNGFQKGHCVLCVGTDAKTILKIQGVKLLPSHAYAVVDIRETSSERWLTLIDSRVPAIGPEDEECSSSSSSRMLNMRWDDICATFEGVYVSWDPDLFWHSVDIHEVWKPANANDDAQASVRHLRLLYECRNSRNGDGDPLDTSKDIWVLLTRHLSHTHRNAEYISLTVYADDADDRRNMWVKAGDKQIKGMYTTSPHVLVRTKVGKEFLTPWHQRPSISAPATKISGALSIIASYDGPFEDVYFTVNVFCGADIKMRWDVDAGIGDTISSSGFSSKHDGTLTTKNAGGNCTHPTYMINPQWHLRIHDEKPGSSGRARALHSSKSMGNLKMNTGVSDRMGRKSVVVLSVQGPRELPLNVTVVWSSGERIAELTQKEVVTSSGAYAYGQARTVGEMAPGDYTVIVSAFEPQVHLGPFTLKVDSSRQFDLVSIPPEGAGMYTRVSKGEWDEHTAVGGPSQGRYHLNPIYEVQLPSRAQLSARLHLVSSAPTAALNLSLFLAPSSPSEVPTLDRALASSGPFSDALSGVCIPTRMLNAGKYWFVPSTYSAGTKTSFRLVVYCSDAGCIVSRR